MRQQLLDFERRERSIEALRTHLKATALLPSDVSLIVTLARSDERSTVETYGRNSRRQLASVASIGGSTVERSLRRLQHAGVAIIAVSRRGYEYLVNWSAVWSLPRRPPARERQLQFAAMFEYEGDSDTSGCPDVGF